jgi:hypothetical protein
MGLCVWGEEGSHLILLKIQEEKMSILFVVMAVRKIKRHNRGMCFPNTLS